MSAVWSAERTSDACAQVGFRAGAGDVHAALDQAVDECADDLGAVHAFAVLVAHVLAEPIEHVNLAIEKNDRHFRPWFIVDRRSAGAGFTVRGDRACA